MQECKPALSKRIMITVLSPTEKKQLPWNWDKETPSLKSCTSKLLGCTELLWENLAGGAFQLKLKVRYFILAVKCLSMAEENSFLAAVFLTFSPLLPQPAELHIAHDGGKTKHTHKKSGLSFFFWQPNGDTDCPWTNHLAKYFLRLIC